jgi:hypothetical protein
MAILNIYIHTAMCITIIEYSSFNYVDKVMENSGYVVDMVVIRIAHHKTN